MLRSSGVLIECTALQSAGSAAFRRSSRSSDDSVVAGPMRSPPSPAGESPESSRTRLSATSVSGVWWRRFMLG